MTTEAVPLLNSGPFRLIAPSSEELALQQEPQPIALVVRPGAPPQVMFGDGTNLDDDPLLRVRMDRVSFDFYIWSLDRFVRFLTATFDLDIPMNLIVAPEGLVPVIDNIRVTHGIVTDSDLLREDPQALADQLADLIAGQVGQILGGVPPTDLNGALADLGLELHIPETVGGQGSPGVRRLTKDRDRYLGIFASLAVAGQGAQVVADTRGEVVETHVDAAGVELPTMTPDNAPRLRLAVGSSLESAARPVEYTYRIDRGAWHPFTRTRIIDVQDGWLRLQGRHTISVRSRIAGQPMSLDPTPATVEFVIDVDTEQDPRRGHGSPDAPPGCGCRTRGDPGGRAAAGWLASLIVAAITARRSKKEKS
jgi:MYXO-CTERM domain-containing protein